MAIQIIFTVTMYPTLFVLYFVMRGVGDAKNGYSFGSSMRAEWMKDVRVEAVIAAYRRELKRIAVVLALVPLVSYVVPYMSIALTIWMIWLLFVIGMPAIPYVRAHHRMREIKQEMGWEKQGNGERLAELKNAGMVRRVKLSGFLPPLLLSAVAAIGAVYFLLRGMAANAVIILTFAPITLLVYGVAVWMDRQRTEVISSDSEINLNYARARKQVWKNCWLVVAWSNTVVVIVLLVLLLIDSGSMAGIVCGSILYTLVLTGALWRATKKLRAVDERYKNTRDMSDPESDVHWIWGLIYYNKNDKRVIVNNRAGLGTTMNLATPAGMGVTVLGYAVIVLVVPLSCIWLMLEEFTPIQLTVKDNVLTAAHVKEEYEIPVSGIGEVTLVEELPVWSKSYGTAMDRLEKGSFHIRNVGDCEVIVNPENAIFLHFMADGTEYYMSGADDDETMAAYESLMEAVQ